MMLERSPVFFLNLNAHFRTKNYLCIKKIDVLSSHNKVCTDFIDASLLRYDT